MEREAIKAFNRYLKERGIYTEFWKEVKAQQLYKCSHKSMKQFLKEECPHIFSPIMNMIGWASTRLGTKFWSNEYDKMVAIFSVRDKALDKRTKNKLTFLKKYK